MAADIIWIDAADAKNKPALNIVDMASTYQVVIPLPGIKSEDVSQAFSTGWIQWAGIPKQILVDLDSAFKDRFLNVMDEKCIIVRAAAGQAHWQNGVCERHGGAWKEIWAKLVEEQLVLEEEIAEASAAVSDAKNQLRNRSYTHRDSGCLALMVVKLEISLTAPRTLPLFLSILLTPSLLGVRFFALVPRQPSFNVRPGRPSAGQ